MGQVRTKTPDKNSRPTIETKPSLNKVTNNQEQTHTKYGSSYIKQ
jgi:hypothetical protein